MNAAPIIDAEADDLPIVILDDEAPALSPQVVRDLHAYAEGRLQTTAGITALARFDLDVPDTLRAYRIGYLPADFRQVLTEDQCRMLSGMALGGTIVLPAYDAQGAVVDLVAMQARDRGSCLMTLWDHPRGLCAPTLCTACDRLVVTTEPRWVGRLFRTVGPTLLLRGVENAHAEAARIAAGGVRHVELHCRTRGESGSIAGILQGVGIMVRVVDAMPTEAIQNQPPTAKIDAPSSGDPAPVVPAPVSLELVSHDAQAEQAVFRYGPATYTVQVPWGTTTTAEVIMAVGTAHHRDRFDLAVTAQRLRFAVSAGLRTKRPSADIATALALILPAVQALAVPSQEANPATAPEVAGMSQAERDAALALLRASDLLPRLLADLDALGWVGEQEAKMLVLLAAISRLGDEPVWTVLTADAAGERFPALGILAAITPPESRLHLSRLTDNALFHGAAEALRHKLLILDDLSGIGPAAATALRVLHARGVLTGTQVEREPLQGGMRTRVVEAQGPLAVITASTGTVPTALKRQFVAVAMDESPAQTERLVAIRQRVTAPADLARITARLVNAQRLLRSLPVSIPTGIAVPALVSRHRALHGPFFGLLAASALLHQHQRPLIDGRLMATAADVELASRVVLPLASQVIDGFGPRAQAAMTALGAIGSSSFTMADLARLMPDWSLGTVRRAVDDLLVAECVVALRRRNGVCAEYRVVTGGTRDGDLCSFPPPFHASDKVQPLAVANG